MEREHDTDHQHKLSLEDNSPYRVAYDLMKDIAAAEKKELNAQNSEEYYLNLFSKCRNAVFERRPLESTPVYAHAEGHHHTQRG